MPTSFSGVKALLLAVVLTVAGLVVVTPAAHAAPTALSLSRTTAIAHESVTVTVRAGQKLRRPVRLQFRQDGTWRDWRAKKTNAKGVAKFSVSTGRSSTTVRAVFPRTKVKGKRRPVRVTPKRVLRTVRQAVALQVVPDVAARTVGGSATVTPARAGRKVSLERRETDGTWRTIVSGRPMDARGRVTFASFASEDASEGRQYRAQASARAGAPALASSPATVAWPVSIVVQAPRFGGEGEPTRLSATTRGHVTSVRFYVDGEEVDRAASAPWEVQWQPTRGRHDVTARAIGSGGTALSSVVEFDQPGALKDMSTGLPSGFSIDTLQAGFTLPTSLAVTDTGRVFVTEKSGRVLTFVRSSDGGGSTPQVVADLRSHVGTDRDRGMTGLAVHPRFGDGSGDYDKLYVSYVLAQDEVSLEAQVQQVQMIDVADWAEGDDPVVHDADRVILGSATDESCMSRTGPFPDDCIPMIGFSHTIGDLVFDQDENLLVGMGDGSMIFVGLGDRSESLRAQDPRVLAGKVLRVDPETGRGVDGNPYYDDDEFDNADRPGTSNASRVIAMGLRNPFRLTVRDDGLVMIGEVGESDWEELDVIEPGTSTTPVNFGWPCYEGEVRTPVPVSVEGEPDVESNAWDLCRVLWDAGSSAVAGPVHTYAHAGGASVTGGVFYTGDVYPPDYRGRYFFGDYAQDFIHTVRVDDDGSVSQLENLAGAGAAGGPVKFIQGPDDRIWYLSIYDGSIRVIDYVAPADVSTCPVGTFARTYHDLTDSSLGRELGPDPWEVWGRFIDAVLPVESVGSRECVDAVQMATTNERPHAELPSDRYGVRWQGRVRLDGGEYEFVGSGKAWIRLWVDEQLQYDGFAWGWFGDQHATIKLPAGIHAIRFELVHDEGEASAGLDWNLTRALPTIDLLGPVNGEVLVAPAVDGVRGATVNYRFEATAGSQDNDLESAEVTADLIHVTGHDQHAHPFRTDTFALSGQHGVAAGSIRLDDAHARGNSAFRLRAKVTDVSGASRLSAPVYVCLQGNEVGICSVS